MTVLTPRELSALLRLSERTIREHAKAGTFPAIRIGKTMRFTLESIQVMLGEKAHGR